MKTSLYMSVFDNNQSASQVGAKLLHDTSLVQVCIVEPVNLPAKMLFKIHTVWGFYKNH